MDESCSTDGDDHFLNALNDFPFDDCIDCTAQSDPESLYSPPHSAPALSSSSDSKFVEFCPNSPSKTDSSSGLRRRRSLAKHTRQELPSDSSQILMSAASSVSEVNGGGGDTNIKKVDSLHLKKNQETESVKLNPDGTGSALSGVVDSISEEKFGDYTSTSSNGDGMGDSGRPESLTNTENEEDQPDFLFFLAELVIKAIGFQLSLIVGFVSFPFWVMYTSYMFLLNPFATIRRGRDYLLGKVLKICNLLAEAVAPSMSEWFQENHSFFKVAVRCAWGLFWSAYVCSVLVALLVSAFVGSGLIMRCLVEEPFHQKHSLNFDFTENKPVAIVPIATASSSKSSVNFGEVSLMEIPGVERVITPNRKLQATVRLTLPESDYNRQLGMFQVRIEFMAANGKALASLRQPCMLHFRSDPIRLLQVFLKIVPLVAGYSSESQTLNLNFRGFTEGDVPSAYLKVIMEQRAEFRPAGGIPEVYDAALLLESELPLLKSILWSWRKTLFVWLSMVLFMIELLFALVCCRAVVMPSLRPQNRVGAAAANGGENTGTGMRIDWRNAR